MAKDLQFTFRRPCLTLSGEIGSLAELIGYMQEESATLTLAFGDDMEMVVQRINGVTGEPAASAPAAEEAPAKRRGPNKPKDPVVAVAPAPLPIPAAPAALPLPAPTATLPPNQLAPAAPPVAPSLAIPADGGIPPFLARAPELPSPPVAPVAPVAPPPVGVLGPKIVKALDLKKAESPDGGPMLADWLAACGLTIKGATYDEACSALLFIGDGKLKAVADILGIAA